MRLRQVRVIYLKELRETLRDRRTLFVMLGLPVLLYPLMFLALSAVLESHIEKLTRADIRVGLLGEPLDEGLAQALWAEGSGLVESALEESGGAGEDLCDRARAALLEKQVEAVLISGAAPRCGDAEGDEELQPSPSSSGALARLLVLHDGANEMSSAGAARVRRAVLREGRRRLKGKLVELGSSATWSAPFAVTLDNIASEERMGGHFAGRVVPMILVMMVILGAFYPAIDLTAGEKERGTLETLLISPVRPGEIVAGKYLTVVTLSMIAASVNMLSMGLTVQRMAASLSEVNGSFSISLGVAFTILLLLVPTAFFFSALVLAVATLARDFKEGQSLLTPVYMVCVLPAVLASLPGLELDWATAFAPGVNVTLVVRDVLAGQARLESIFLVMLANSLYAGVTLVFARRLLSSEQVLFGGGGGFRSLKGIWAEWRQRRRREGPARTPSPGSALVFFGATLVLLYYVASLLQERAVVSGLLATEWGLLLVPALGLVFLGRHSPRETLSLRLPSARSWVGTLLVALSAWALALVVAAGQQLVMPTPEAYTEALKRFFDPESTELSLPGMLFLTAVSPAICEEVVFRGVVQAGLRRALGRWGTVLVVGGLFGLFHLSIYRIVPTAVLGMLLTFVAWQTGSIYPAMLIHFASNALVLGASSYEPLGSLLGIHEGGVRSWWVIVALLCTALPLGLWLLWREAPGRRRWPRSAMLEP